MDKHDDIEMLLIEIMESKDFQKSLEASGESLVGYSEQEIRAMAEELKDQVIEAYLGAVSIGAQFDTSTVSVGDYSSNKEQASIKISFDGSGLYRPSLYSEKYPDGVYDIFGLLTHGYTAKGEVYGLWRDKRIASLHKRPPSNFLKMVADEFENTHAGVQVILPDEWI